MSEELMIDTPEGIRHYLMGGPKLPGIRVIRPSSGGQQMAVVSEGTVKGGVNNNEEKPIALNENRDLIVTQGMSPYVELSRLGGGYSAIATSAVAALIVRPGTTAMFTLWNGESTGGKSYVIDRLFTHNLLSTAAAAFFGIWACVHPANMTNPGVDIARSATNITGNTGKTYSGQGVVGVAETVVDNGWYPWTNSVEVTTATTLPGAHLAVNVEGRLIVPPTGGISLTVVASLATQDFTTGCSWYEVQLDLQ
ncbi:hypothetical protein LCGC14_1647610 [marine sediment metagenome]|uniref:Uncharacterized protein n=1 Tax=marine sediment metagenome TaxID=412755 RepID=A0A0F9KXS4_9ZZZZ